MRKALAHDLIGDGIDGGSLALLGPIAALDAMPIEASPAARAAVSDDRNTIGLLQSDRRRQAPCFMGSVSYLNFGFR
jgi:hypothetical protein